MRRKVRILIADRNRMMREGLRAIIEQTDDMDVVGEMGDDRTALSLVERLRPDVALVDLELKEPASLDFIDLLSHASPRPCVIAMATYPDDSVAHRALCRGASSTFLKTSSRDDIIEAIRQACPSRNPG
ncbi:response regulator [Luteibacter yeojuensis]|uniref:Response regulator transcription factor n=1 Tax=Luteibacter yeojuensis TaxID=345309 RepID=A0A7X5QSM8_9GAMM|nr:response regulator transcription factor [Luteibacter yeojuensis]